MSKTLVDIDDDLLRSAQEALGTVTKKDTVNAALREAVAVAARRREILRFASDSLPDLRDPDIMGAAWR